MSTTATWLCPPHALASTDPQRLEPLTPHRHGSPPTPSPLRTPCSCPSPWSRGVVSHADCIALLSPEPPWPHRPQEKMPHLISLSPAALMYPESLLASSLPPLLIFSHTCVPPSSESRLLICSELWPRGLHLSGRTK